MRTKFQQKAASIGGSCYFTKAPIMHIRELSDRAFLKELVDRVSILADKKDFHNQVQLFTENAVSETFAGGALVLKLKGRKEMEEAFGDFLKNFDTVYHFNANKQ